MFMRFSRRYVPGRVADSEIRFGFARVHAGMADERVRLWGGDVRWAANSVEQERLEMALRHVLATVALPRHRANTEITIEQITAALRTFLCDEDWRCINPTRVCRRRRRRWRSAMRDFTTPNHFRHAVHNYSYKPSPRFRVGGGEDAEMRAFFGVELELDQQVSGQLDPSAVPDVAHPLFYCKQDGSLNNGVELVSHPGSQKWWEEQRGNVETILALLSRTGWRSHEIGTCGMHVHVSASAFENSMHIYRFLHLVYRFPTLALLVSQRSKRRLEQWSSLKYNKKPTLKRKANLRLKRNEFHYCEDGGHYDGVNQTAHTFELRIFNGTMNPKRFYKNLQYTWAVLAFTKDTLNLRHITAARFVAWVAEHAVEYPDLAAFFIEHADHPALAEKRKAA